MQSRRQTAHEMETTNSQSKIENEGIMIDCDRPRQRRRISESSTPVVDLTTNQVNDDRDGVSNSKLESRCGLLFQSEARKRTQIAPTPPKEKTIELELSSLQFQAHKLLPRKAVELNSGDFLRIQKLVNKLTIRNSDEEIIRSENILIGALFRPARKVSYLSNKFNEVVLIEEGCSVSLEDVKCIRRLILTNAPFPQHRDAEWLVCRWVWGISDETRKEEGEIRRISEWEADENFRYTSDLLRDAWRKPLIEDLKAREERAKKEAEERSRITKARIRSTNSYTVDLTRDPHFASSSKNVQTAEKRGKEKLQFPYADPTDKGKQTPISLIRNKTSSPHTKSKLKIAEFVVDLEVTERPITPQKLSTLNMDEGYFAGSSQSTHSSPRSNIPSERQKDIVLLSSEDEEDVSLLKLHRENLFTPVCSGKTQSAPLTPASGVSSTQSREYAQSLSATPQLPHAPRCKYTFGDAFCGAGGTSCAAEMAGFKVRWGVDKDEAAIDTFKTNFSRATAYHQSIDIFLRMDENMLVDVVHLSPPCQPYSPAHTVEGRHDEDNQAAMFAIESTLDKCRPRMATLEQTNGILNHDDYFWGLLSQFLQHGFSVAYRVLKGVEYGMPQNRKRLFVVAAGPGETLPPFPNPTHWAYTPEPGLFPQLPSMRPSHPSQSTLQTTTPAPLPSPNRPTAPTSSSIAPSWPAAETTTCILLADGHSRCES
ncbi:S-adenosyl-L-methionine-dependent methyltransferase [Kalaharituber pfeilii]|nr:S-adenosyl-L-methionine-dependent methyltransferase [Kalaharituber pfeilii]